MAFEPGLPFERVRYDIDSKVGLAAGAVARMAFVLVGFIDDRQALGGESFSQPSRDQILCPHGRRHSA